MTTIIDKNKAYPLARDSLNSIKILTPNGLVKGLLQETLKFSIEANYEQVMHLNEYFGTTSNLANLAVNKSLFNTGIATRKYYKGGSYIRIEPKIRIVDWEGVGSPVISTLMLMNAALPTTDKSISDIIEKIATGANFDLSNLNEASDFALFGGFAFLQGASLGNAILVGGAGSGFAQTTLGAEIKSGLVEKGARLIKEAVTNNPTPVLVTVSNYFTNEFLIENVSVEFSKEMTDAGPLYCDISLSLSTPEVAQKGAGRGATGLIIGNRNRISRK